MASHTVKMPQLGESVLEGILAEWYVKVGDKVAVDDPLCVVQTDKADAEVPSPHAGYVAEILAQKSAEIEVGAAIVVISDEAPEGVDTSAPAPAPAPAAAPSPAPAAPSPSAAASASSAPSAPSIQLSASPTSAPANAPAAAPWSQPASFNFAPPAPAPRPHAAPAAAQRPDRWVPFGHPDGASAYRYPKPRVEDGDTVEKFSRRRAIIAEHMVISQSVSPHVVTVAEVDMTDVVALREVHKKRLRAQGVNITFLTFLLKATCQALREFPVMNSVVGDGELILKGNVHLGFAAETDAGLVVPVIRNADELNVVGLAKNVTRLANKAREGNLEPSDLAGGTFTVSNPGLKGNLYGGAIINQPQVGIVRMGELKKRPMVISQNGQDVIAIRSMMYLALSYDHRVVDGVTGNSFLFRIRELLEAADFHLG